MFVTQTNLLAVGVQIVLDSSGSPKKTIQFHIMYQQVSKYKDPGNSFVSLLFPF